MAEVKHYRLQADRAKRLAKQVTDEQMRRRLLETAEEYTRYAALLEARSFDRQSRRELIGADA
jgi:replicative DNA helicase